MSTQTINEYMDMAYGEGGGEIMKNLGLSTSGTRNPMFGRFAFTNFNNAARTWMALPKKVWKNSGWRVRHASGTTHTNQGVADGGNVGTAVESSHVEVTTNPKLMQTVCAVNLAKSLLKNDDDILWEDEVKVKADDHVKDINKNLWTDADTLAGDNIESVDRVVSNQSESALFSAATDADIYGIDRHTAASWADAYVSHNSGTDRNLDEDMLMGLIDGVEENSGLRPNVIVTGFDTGRTIDKLFADETRYDPMRVTFSVNGISTRPGSDAGFTASSYQGIPIVVDSDVPKDTGSRVYALNTDHLFIATALPTQFLQEDNPLALGSFEKKGVYLTIGELICTNFRAQGKIRDLN